jgi:xanthine dehydrogenase YagS FAD-binding subunit
MNPFTYAIARGETAALEAWSGNPGALYVAGEDVVHPELLIDISRIPLTHIEIGPKGARIGAMARLSDVADDQYVRTYFPMLCQALRETASPQVRNLATMGGNLLQRTRCLYFRDKASACNKRLPGSGCPAQEGANRMNAILGGSDDCIAAYAGDMAVALVALDARVQVRGPEGERSIEIQDLHRRPGADPSADTTLRPGEIVTEIVLPPSKFAGASAYIKMRDRATFEWPVVSAAVGLEMEGATVRAARVAVGGVGTKPWPLPRVEKALVGGTLDAAAAAAKLSVEGATAHGENEFKLKLLPRCVERAILTAGGQL